MVLETHGFADAHAHVSEKGFSDRYPDFDRAVIVFGCTARPSEWDAMAACAVPGTVRFYGVHPWYADEWDEASAGRLESILEEDPRANVGEIGLDGKRGDPSLQRPAFESQLDLASGSGRIANVHMVGCERDVLESVRRHAGGCRAVVLHSFSSESYVKPFAEVGCMFSINPRILARSESRIARLLRSVPEDRLLLETDAPYLAREFSGMTGFADRLAGILGTTGEELMRLTLDNARRIADV